MRAVGEQAAPGDHEVVARHGAPQQSGEDVLCDAAAVAVGRVVDDALRALLGAGTSTASANAGPYAVDGVPAAADPLLDLLAEVHAARKDRFFAS